MAPSFKEKMLTADVVAGIREAVQQTTDGGCMLSRLELKRLFTMLGGSFSPEELNDLFTGMDALFKVSWHDFVDHLAGEAAADAKTASEDIIPKTAEDIVPQVPEVPQMLPAVSADGIKEGPYQQVLARSGGKTAIDRNKSISDDVLESVKRSCARYESLDPWQQDKIHQCMTFEDLSTRARKVKQRFDEVILQLVDGVNQKFESHLGALKSGGVKSAERGKKKCTVKYAGDASQMSDMVRGTIVINGTIDDLYAVVKGVVCSPLMNKRCMHFTHFSDRFQHPMGDYYDLLALVRVDGFACELQFNLKCIIDIKESPEGHGNYEVARLANDDLLIACVRNNLEDAQQAMGRGAKPARLAESKHGLSALHFAVYHGNAALINMLLEAGADPCHADYDGHLPLSHAVMGRDINVIKCLIHSMDATNLLKQFDAKSGPAFMHCAELVAEMGPQMADVAVFFGSVAERALEHESRDVRSAAACALSAFPSLGARLADKCLQVSAEVEVLNRTDDLWERLVPQVLVMASIRIQYTKRVEQTLREHASFDEHHNEIQAIIKQLVRLLKRELTDLQHEQLRALIALFTELRNTLSQLRNIQSSDDVGEFWKGELRFYNLSDGRVQCMCAGAGTILRQECASFSALVTSDFTKMARRAYFQAVAEDKVLISCGAAGSGKTETIKDITHTLGIEALVVQASENGVDFSRALLEAFRTAKHRGNKTPVILDEAIRLPQASIDMFVTNARAAGALPCLTFNPEMNARTKISEEMMSQNIVINVGVPDKELLYANIFCLQGFENSDILGRGMSQIVETASQKCSKKTYYDWGMRFLKHLGVKAGQLLGQEDTSPNAQRETTLVAKALRDELWRCLTKEDKKILKALINEYLIEPPPLPEKLMIKDKWLRVAAFLSNAIQGKGKHAALVLPVGPETKEACMAAMQKEATDAGVEIRVVARTMAETSVDEFLGANDSAGDWVEGSFTKAIRSAQNSSKAIWFFVDCGKVNNQDEIIKKLGVQFEELSPLMDQNRTLCLGSGEILPLEEEHRIIFLAEEETVATMSPATLSRMAVTFASVDA